MPAGIANDPVVLLSLAGNGGLGLGGRLALLSSAGAFVGILAAAAL